ncbi:hypothetical protein CYMTET_14963 [Cymbomonas tetramitiformis]|uniref:Uncharacterized protein n=1 Tax=Cymbomonas tetramitiformis TaxID=36881 RepID=A0AAE0GFB3_9CHLO|nr:hypothetical protein CYMTET_14963 [Cymbomonas tetramitiformis]
MLDFTVETLIPMPANIYFLERDSAAFRSLYAQSLQMGQLEVLSHVREGSEVKIRTRYFPSAEVVVPGPLRCFVKAQLVHEEVEEYDLSSLSQPPYHVRFRQFPPIVGTKAVIEGTITIEEVDDETCRHRLACSVQVPMLFRVPGTGRIAETGVRDNMQKATRSLRRIVERWLVMREALLTAEGAEVALWKGGTALHWLSKDVLESLRAPSSQTVEALQRGSSGGWRHLGAVLRVARGAEDDAAPRVQRARSRDSVASCGSEPDDASLASESSFVDASSELALSPGGAPRDAAGLPTETNARGAGGDGKLGLAHSETATSDASSEAASFFDADEYFYFNPEEPLNMWAKDPKHELHQM